MYRSDAVSFHSKLSRLSLPVPAASAKGVPAPVTTSPPLDELRARMQAVLERHAKRTPLAPPVAEPTELPFAKVETDRGALWIRTQVLSAAHRTGRAPVLAARASSSHVLALLALDPALAACDPARALYLDTETTGLHGGTGTIAFLVGLAFWDESGRMTVEQILVRDLGEEGPMLARVAARIATASMLVTFNGKSFDLPLLRTRFVMARLAAPREPPHLDLLHVARRIHKPRGVECKLVTIERDVLGFERVDDVPGNEVSACYLHFLRSGDGHALLGVIEHNAWDVVTMVAMVGLYGEPMIASSDEGGEGGVQWATPLDPRDLVGVARTMYRAGARDEAWSAIEHAVANGGGDESLRARAELAKARGDRARALADFEALADGVDDTRVRLELAKLYEHLVRDHARALAQVERGTGEKDVATAKRRARLERKRRRSVSAQPAIPGLEPSRTPAPPSRPPR
jgi:uncharacterized protein YprB with RNaseH-like and TPR domain